MGSMRWTLLPASLVLAACSADAVDLGDGRLGIDRNALESYAAVWEGYVEAYEFGSGSDRIRLVLDEQGNGTFTFGEGEPLPEPTDPDEAFPFERFVNPVDGSPAYVPIPLEGFDYTVSGALVEDERLRASSAVNEVFDSACALQTPIPVDPQSRAMGYPDYACMPEYPFGYNEESAGGCSTGRSQLPLSCAKAQLCNSSYCACTATACGANAEEQLRLDAALNDAGDRLEGTLLGRLDRDDRVTVRLTRVAAP
jgi:hypothetical protein